MHIANEKRSSYAKASAKRIYYSCAFPIRDAYFSRPGDEFPGQFQTLAIQETA
jgi:hypothetical protein